MFDENESFPAKPQNLIPAGKDCFEKTDAAPLKFTTTTPACSKGRGSTTVTWSAPFVPTMFSQPPEIDAAISARLSRFSTCSFRRGVLAFFDISTAPDQWTRQ